MDTPKKPLRVRFAPSPTGELHLGGARTALFNYLLARQTGGSFVVRIEDTDQNRFVAGSADRLLEGLSWLGIANDEGAMPGGGEKGDKGPYVQSARRALYEEAAQKLIAAGHAYYDYLTPEELQERRALAAAAGVVALKEEQLALDPEEAARREAAALPRVVRLRTPKGGTVGFDDGIRGAVTFDYRQVDDQVLVKSDGMPTYHLAVVVDDHAMEIDTVIRAEEWLPSTPKHLYLYECFGWQAPRFVHLPLILNQDKSKMSKRKDGDRVWISAYQAKGYVPSAMVNFLALLGWHDTGDREYYEMDDLVRDFSLERVQKSGAIFDVEKLNAVNKLHLAKLDGDAFAAAALPFVSEETKKELEKIKKGMTERALVSSRDRVEYFAQCDGAIADFLPPPPYDKALLPGKKGTEESAKRALQAGIAALGESPFEGMAPEAAKERLDAVAEKNGLSRGELLWPLRVALSGKEKSVDPFSLLATLPTGESALRIEKALAML